MRLMCEVEFSLMVLWLLLLCYAQGVGMVDTTDEIVVIL